ncbi:hypothetical protein SAY86_000848 [Trapa natans]|uniref:Transmembrane protein n=1 Tax=Trapa natans TaxID=22666 RepID=A0AAN7MV36_TRANT|nr:hypothetical protein SAY86_000848 [Trapa natans]
MFGTMFSSSNIISCNFSHLPFKSCPSISRHQTPAVSHLKILPSPIQPYRYKITLNSHHGNHFFLARYSFLDGEESKGPRLKTKASSKSDLADKGDGGDGKDWTSSILLFFLWVALLYYVFNLAPNQTPSMDTYFLQKLLNLKGDDGFKMNEVLVSLWYIMGLWPLMYGMLLLPAGRSSKGSPPLWPFLALSFFGGIYALIPYFVLWKPPPYSTEESELRRWPLNFLESKLTAGALLAGGLGLIIYAALANGDVWEEFYRYFRGSKFIHVTSIDFSLLSAFAPFWVYNDMTHRKWYEKGFWLLPLSAIPFLGPALYLVLRPSLPTTEGLSDSTYEQEQLVQK